jgi:YggT family protein
MMAPIVSVLSGIISVYMILIFIRILLTWFSGADFAQYGRSNSLYVFLCSICDPYLNWFRRFRIFKTSFVDFSSLVALAFLSFVHNIFLFWGRTGRISIALVLNLFFQAVLSILFWVLGFFVVILLLRMIAFLGNFNIYSPFWHFIDFISQPILYRISRIFFPARITGYLFRIIFSIAALIILGILAWGIVQFASMLLLRLPL